MSKRMIAAASAALTLLMLTPTVSAQEEPPPPAEEQQPPPPPQFYDVPGAGFVDLETLDMPIKHGETHKVGWRLSATVSPALEHQNFSVATLLIPKTSNIRNITVKDVSSATTMEVVQPRIQKTHEGVAPLFEGEQSGLHTNSMSALVRKNPSLLAHYQSFWGMWEGFGLHPERWVNRETNTREGLVSGEDGKPLRTKQGDYVYVVAQWRFVNEEGRPEDKHHFLFRTIPKDKAEAVMVEAPKSEADSNDPEKTGVASTVPLVQHFPMGRTPYPALLEFASDEVFGGSAPQDVLIQHDVDHAKSLTKTSPNGLAEEFSREASDLLGVEVPSVTDIMDVDASIARGFTMFVEERTVNKKLRVVEKNSGSETRFGDPIPDVVFNVGEPTAQVDASDPGFVRVFVDTLGFPQGAVFEVTGEVDRGVEASAFPVQAFMSHIVQRTPDSGEVKLVDVSRFPFGRGQDPENNADTPARGMLAQHREVNQREQSGVFGNQQCLVTARSSQFAPGVDVPSGLSGERNNIDGDKPLVVNGSTVQITGQHVATVTALEDFCDQVLTVVPQVQAKSMEDVHKQDEGALSANQWSTIMLGGVGVFGGLAWLIAKRISSKNHSKKPKPVKKQAGESGELF